MYINITVTQKRDAAFLKLCPKAIVRYRTHDKDFVYYKITDKEYMRNYQDIDSMCTVEMLKGTNYVKITGSISGNPVKLFVRETQVYKVLNKITKDPERLGYTVGEVCISIRKVKIANRYSKLLEPIVLKSLAYVGVAA